MLSTRQLSQLRQQHRLSHGQGQTDESAMRCCLCRRSHFPAPFSSSSSPHSHWLSGAEYGAYDLVQWDVLTFVHPLCLQVCSSLGLKASGEALRQEAERARRRECVICRRRGATVRCELCAVFFHLPCYLLSQPDEERGKLPFRCPNHSQEEDDECVVISNVEEFATTAKTGDNNRCTVTSRRSGTASLLSKGRANPAKGGTTTPYATATSGQPLCSCDRCLCPKGRNYFANEAWNLLFCRQCEKVSVHVRCFKNTRSPKIGKGYLCSNCSGIRKRRGRPTTRSKWGGNSGVSPSGKRSVTTLGTSPLPITPSPSPSFSVEVLNRAKEDTSTAISSSSSSSDKENESGATGLSARDKRRALKRARHVFSDDLDKCISKNTRSRSKDEALVTKIKGKSDENSTTVATSEKISSLPKGHAERKEPKKPPKTTPKKALKKQPKKKQTKKLASKKSKSCSKPAVKEPKRRGRPKKSKELPKAATKSSPPLSPAKKFVEEGAQGRAKKSQARRQLSSQDPIPLSNRTLHHVKTNLPLLNGEPEAEEDYQWLPDLSLRQIDEFVDLNDGEKALMQLWNTHMFANPCFGDQMLVAEIRRFVDLRGVEIVRRNLYSNFLLHLVNLHDHDVFDVATLNTLIQQIQSVVSRGANEEEAVEDAVVCDSSTAMSVVGHAGCVRRSLQPDDAFVQQDLAENSAIAYKRDEIEPRRRRSGAA